MWAPARRSEGSAIMVENVVLLILAAGLMVYLFVCLLKPEKF